MRPDFEDWTGEYEIFNPKNPSVNDHVQLPMTLKRLIPNSLCATPVRAHLWVDLKGLKLKPNYERARGSLIMGCLCTDSISLRVTEYMLYGGRFSWMCHIFSQLVILFVCVLGLRHVYHM